MVFVSVVTTVVVRGSVLSDTVLVSGLVDVGVDGSVLSDTVLVGRSEDIIVVVVTLAFVVTLVVLSENTNVN